MRIRLLHRLGGKWFEFFFSFGVLSFQPSDKAVEKWQASVSCLKRRMQGIFQSIQGCKSTSLDKYQLKVWGLDGLLAGL
jgi:hypothetical protein